MKDEYKVFIMPIVIGLSALILSISYYSVQTQKQKSIEKQVKDKTNLEIAIELARQEDMNKCIANAEFDRWEYLKLNGTYNEAKGTVWNDGYTQKKAEDKYQDDVDNCIAMFKK